jgi:hypothetical protein
MPTSTTSSSTGTFVMTSVAGSMGTVNTGANEILVGATWRIRFSGNVTNAAAFNNLTFQITHAGGTQSIFAWTYLNSTSLGGFNGEIMLFWSAVGASSSVIASGYINYQDGTSASIKNISLPAFIPVYSTIVPNTNAMQIVASPATGFTYALTNFTVEWLR